jgi:DnaK suppressor protein
VLSHSSSPRAELESPSAAHEVLLHQILTDHRQSRRDQLAGLYAPCPATDVRLDDPTRKRMILATLVALEELEAALQRYADGTYGWCTDCLRQIPYSTLTSCPQLRYCLDCLTTG